MKYIYTRTLVAQCAIIGIKCLCERKHLRKENGVQRDADVATAIQIGAIKLRLHMWFRLHMCMYMYEYAHVCLLAISSA